MYIEDFIAVRHEELSMDLRHSIPCEVFKSIQKEFAGLKGVIKFKKHPSKISWRKRLTGNLSYSEEKKDKYRLITIPDKEISELPYIEIEEHSSEEYKKYIKSNDGKVDTKKYFGDTLDKDHWYIITVYF